MLFTMAVCLYHQDRAQIKPLNMAKYQIVSLQANAQLNNKFTVTY